MGEASAMQASEDNCHNTSDICIHHSHAICFLDFYSYILVIEIFTVLIDFQELRNELYFKVIHKSCQLYLSCTYCDAALIVTCHAVTSHKERNLKRLIFKVYLGVTKNQGEM